MALLYSIVRGQCSCFMQYIIKALKDYEKIDRNNNLVKLLKEIKVFGNKIEENTSQYEALHSVKTKLIAYCQTEDESLTYQQFQRPNQHIGILQQRCVIQQRNSKSGSRL